MTLMRLLVLCSLVFVLPVSVRAQQIIDTVAGGNWPNGIPATQAGIGGAQSVALDASGNLYIASTNHQRIYRVDAATGVITTAAGTGVAGFNGDNIPATAGLKPEKIAINDINGDGVVDLIAHFNTQVLNAAGLLSNGRRLYVTGQLTDGKLLLGSEVVNLSDAPVCN